MARPSPLLSNLLLTAGLLSAAFSVYWFLHTSFAPVEVSQLPPQAPAGNLRFDPSVDVTKKAAWPTLRPMTDHKLEPGVGGRDNPFEPISTSTTP